VSYPRADLGPIRCDFCGETYEDPIGGESAPLICGPNVVICKPCVGVCQDIIHDDIIFSARNPETRRLPASPRPVPGHKYLVTIGPIGSVRLRAIQLFAWLMAASRPSIKQLVRLNPLRVTERTPNSQKLEGN
jgi:hypothetical protein